MRLRLQNPKNPKDPKNRTTGKKITLSILVLKCLKVVIWKVVGLPVYTIVSVNVHDKKFITGYKLQCLNVTYTGLVSRLEVCRFHEKS